MIGRVVSGLLVREDGHILMGKRRRGKLRGELWETPGGKVDPGEDPLVALVREWREELRCDVVVGDLVGSAVLDLEVSFVIDLYQVHLTPGSESPGAFDHEAIEFVDPWEAVRRRPCSPAFYAHWPWMRLHLRLGHVPPSR